MNKLINIVLSGLLWRRYKFLLVSIIVLFAFVFLVGQIHQDYLAYAQTVDNAMVGWSFALKWLVWIVAIFVFFGANHWVNSQKQKQADKEEKNSALQRIIAWKNNGKSKDKSSLSNVSNGSQESLKSTDETDPFANLRTKEKLRSYADLIIEKKHRD